MCPAPSSMQPQASGLPTLSSIRFHRPGPRPAIFLTGSPRSKSGHFASCRGEQLLGLSTLPLLSFPKEVPSVGEALPVSAQQIQAGFASMCLAHTPFSLFGLSPSPTPPQDAHGSLETEQRAACSGHGDGRGQMPRVPIGKGRLGVCLVRAHALWFIKVLYTLSLPQA